MGFRLLTSLLAVWLSSSAQSASATARNIVLVIYDDQAYSDFGCMVNDQVHTPHLDRLAARSARYVNAYVPSSV